MKTVLVLGAGQYCTNVLTELNLSGFRTLAIDRDPGAPGFQIAHAHEVVDITDCQGAAEAARRHGVHGVMAINEFGVRTAAYIAGALGLAGNSMATAVAANDKGVMREVWQSSGLPIPRFRTVQSLREAQDAAAEIGYPVIVKPTCTGGGGRGISIAKSEQDLEWSYDLAVPFASNRRIIVERFLKGTEMTIDALTWRGQTQVLAMSDKWKPPMRYRVATRLNYPAQLPDQVLVAVERIVVGAVKSLGIENGASHTEIIVTDDGPKLVELGARGGGGHVFHTIVKQVCGVNMVVELAKILTGEAPNLEPKHTKGCVYGFFHPPPGTLRAVHGVGDAKAMPGVIDLAVLTELGESIEPLANSLRRVGYFVAGGDSRDEAVDLADRIDRQVVFDIEETET